MNWKRKLRTSILLLTGVMTGIMCYAQNDFISKYAYPEFDEGHEYRVSGVKSFVEGGEITGYVFTGHRIRDEDRELFIFKTDLKGTPQWVQRVPVETVSTIAFQHIDGSTYIAHRISQDGNVHVFSIDQSGAKQWDFYIEETYMYNPIKMKEIKHDNEVVLGLTSGHFEENIINFTAFEPSGNLIGSNHIENFTSLSNNKLVGFSQLPNENIIMSGSPFLNRLNLLEFEIGNNTPVQDVQRRVNYVDEMVVNDIIEIENPNNYMNSPYYLIGGEINGSIMVAMLDDNMNLVWVNHISGRSSVAFELQKETAGYRALLKVRDNLKNYHTIGTVYFEVDAGGITTTGDIIDANNPIGTTSSFVFNTIPTFDIGVDGLSVLATSDYHENDPFLVFLNDMGGTDIGYPPCRLDNIETNYGSYTLGDVYELNLDIYEVGVYPAEIELNTSGFQYQYSCNTPCDVDLEVTGRVCESGNGDQATLTVTSGHSSFSWNTGQSSNSINVDEPGIYTVTVSGYGGCNVAKTFYLEGDPDISSGFQIVPEDQTDLCVFDEPEVEIRLDPIPLDPTGNSTYDWTIDQLGGFDDEVVNGVFLTPGQVSIALDHNNGCGTNLFNSTINIHGVELDPEVINPICHDDAGTGEINLNPTNEYPSPGDITYSWSVPPGEPAIGNTSQPQNLEDGNYTVTVDVASLSGCSQILNFEIETPDPITINPTTQDEECINSYNGSISLSPTPNGGNPPYTYQWYEMDQGVPIILSGETQDEFLAANSLNTYMVEITDAGGCVKEFGGLSVGNQFGTTIELDPQITIEDITCLGACDGEIDFSFTSPSSSSSFNFSYQLKHVGSNTIISNSAPPYENLCEAGEYEVLVTISNSSVNCTRLLNFELQESDYNEWHIKTRNSDDEVDVVDIEQDDEGNVYFLGSFEGETDIQNASQNDYLTINSGNGGTGMFLAKYDECAVLDWVTYTEATAFGANYYGVDLEFRSNLLRVLFETDNAQATGSRFRAKHHFGAIANGGDIHRPDQGFDLYGITAFTDGASGFDGHFIDAGDLELTSIEYDGLDYYVAGSKLSGSNDQEAYIGKLEEIPNSYHGEYIEDITTTSQSNGSVDKVNDMELLEFGGINYIYATGIFQGNVFGQTPGTSVENAFVVRFETSNLSSAPSSSDFTYSGNTGSSFAEALDVEVKLNNAGSAAHIAVIGNFTDDISGWDNTITSTVTEDAFIVFFEDDDFSSPLWTGHFQDATTVTGDGIYFDNEEEDLFLSGTFTGNEINGSVAGQSFHSSPLQVSGSSNIWSAQIKDYLNTAPDPEYILVAESSNQVKVAGVTAIAGNGITAGNYSNDIFLTHTLQGYGTSNPLHFDHEGNTGDSEGFMIRFGNWGNTSSTGHFYKRMPGENQNEDEAIGNSDPNEELKEGQPELVIYPNPNRGNFEIKLDSKEVDGMEMHIYDASGKVIYREYFNTHHANPNIDVAPGFYIVKVIHGEHSFTQQLIVQ